MSASSLMCAERSGKWLRSSEELTVPAFLASRRGVLNGPDGRRRVGVDANGSAATEDGEASTWGNVNFPAAIDSERRSKRLFFLSLICRKVLHCRRLCAKSDLCDVTEGPDATPRGLSTRSAKCLLLPADWQSIRFRGML